VITYITIGNYMPIRLEVQTAIQAGSTKVSSHKTKAKPYPKLSVRKSLSASSV
jgi:hypothetical protein